VDKSTIHRQLQRWNVKTKKVMDFSSDRDDPKNNIPIENPSFFDKRGF